MKNILIGIGALLLIGSLAAFGLARTAHSESNAGECPPGYIGVVQIEPLQPGEEESKVVDQGCQSLSEEMATEVLEPLSPEEARESTPQPTGTSPIVRGPSDSPEYRCVVVLEPLREGETSSQASGPVCGKGPITAVNGISLDSLYLIAKFYDNPNYGSLLIEYYGAYPCSQGYSYGRPDLRADGVDNRFASGQGFSTCNLITVYDLYNYSGPSYACGPDCPTFHALNDAVSSWRITR
jgi:hypothetical protein